MIRLAYRSPFAPLFWWVLFVVLGIFFQIEYWTHLSFIQAHFTPNFVGMFTRVHGK